jgi:uncharacterized protein (DUF433 family)
MVLPRNDWQNQSRSGFQRHEQEFSAESPRLPGKATGIMAKTANEAARKMGVEYESLTERSAIMMDRITFDPHIMGGRACVRGMRITVAHIVNLVANGMSVEQIINEHPDLEVDDVRQALSYAALLTTEELHPLTAAV